MLTAFNAIIIDRDSYLYVFYGEFGFAYFCVRLFFNLLSRRRIMWLLVCLPLLYQITYIVLLSCQRDRQNALFSTRNPIFATKSWWQYGWVHIFLGVIHKERQLYEGGGGRGHGKSASYFMRAASNISVWDLFVRSQPICIWMDNFTANYRFCTILKYWLGATWFYAKIFCW